MKEDKNIEFIEDDQITNEENQDEAIDIKDSELVDDDIESSEVEIKNSDVSLDISQDLNDAKLDSSNDKEIITEQIENDEIINNEDNQYSDNLIIDDSIVKDAKDVKKEKLSKRKQKRQRKIEKEFFNETDIKYAGPLSYRYLRVIAWISFALTQLLLLNTISASLTQNPLLANWVEIIFTIFSALYMPLFLMATFSTILNKNRTYSSVLLFYGVAYFGIALGVVFVFRRYLFPTFAYMFEEDASIQAGNLLGKKLLINVFSDLFILSLFNFFINYRPTKLFRDKKILIFRLLSILPIAFAVLSYILKVLDNSGIMDLPIEIFPFLTTKSPLIYVIFILLALWIKRRERIFIKNGHTHAEYDRYIKTNRNSLSFSKIVCLLFLIISLIDVLLMFLTAIIAYANNLPTDYYWGIYNIGDCSGIFFAIPVMILFSYTKEYKDTKLDLLVPLVGIGLTVIVYIEGVFQIISRVLN